MAWYSLHIGLPSGNSNTPRDREGPVVARRLHDLVASRGARSTLLNQDVTRSRVLQALDDLRRELRAGDLLLVTYTGHGCQVTDKNGDERGGWDQAWCSSTNEVLLLDDELHAYLQRLPEVDVYILADHCYSQTIHRSTRPPVDQMECDDSLACRVTVLAASSEARKAEFGVLSSEACCALDENSAMTWGELLARLRHRYKTDWGLLGPYMTQIQGQTGLPTLDQRVLP